MSSCSACESVSDNKYNSCPPKMSDGRQFTDYTPRCGVRLATVDGKTMNSYELRQYLIHNASTLMSKNSDEAVKQNGCGPCVEPWNQGTMLQEQSVVKCNSSTCEVSTLDPYGLGQGRDYGITPDQEYIAKMTQQNAAMRAAGPINVCVKPSEDSLYYPFNGTVTQEAVERYAVPGGGAPF